MCCWLGGRACARCCSGDFCYPGSGGPRRRLAARRRAGSDGVFWLRALCGLTVCRRSVRPHRSSLHPPCSETSASLSQSVMSRHGQPMHAVERLAGSCFCSWSVRRPPHHRAVGVRQANTRTRGQRRPKCLIGLIAPTGPRKASLRFTGNLWVVLVCWIVIPHLLAELATARVHHAVLRCRWNATICKRLCVRAVRRPWSGALRAQSTSSSGSTSWGRKLAMFSAFASMGGTAGTVGPDRHAVERLGQALEVRRSPPA